MCAFVVLVVEDELWIRLLSPTLWCLVNLFRKRAHGYWNLHASHIEEAAAGRKSMPGVPIQSRRRDRSIRQPVKRDVVEYVVTGQPFSLAVENAGDHLIATNVVIKYPGRQTDRRVDNSVQGLRPIVHLESIAKAVLVEISGLIPRVFLIRREIGGRRAPHRQRFRNIW